MFDFSGKLIESRDSECQSDSSKGYNACTSNPQEPTSKRFPNSTSFLTVHFGNDHVAIILGYGDLKWENILITRVYFVEGLGHKPISRIGSFEIQFSVTFRRSKNEAPEVIKTFSKKIQVLLQAPVIIVRTDNGAEFKNQVLKEYFDSVGISHQSSSVRTP
ncbi:retrovirus-related pol polyprotein from transposon TNT 1-94 [Tanacetum coccineum]